MWRNRSPGLPEFPEHTRLYARLQDNQASALHHPRDNPLPFFTDVHACGAG